MDHIDLYIAKATMETANSSFAKKRKKKKKERKPPTVARVKLFSL
jgi:hypothetical protein